MGVAAAAIPGSGAKFAALKPLHWKVAAFPAFRFGRFSPSSRCERTLCPSSPPHCEGCWNRPLIASPLRVPLVGICVPPSSLESALIAGLLGERKESGLMKRNHAIPDFPTYHLNSILISSEDAKVFDSLEVQSVKQIRISPSLVQSPCPICQSPVPGYRSRRQSARAKRLSSPSSLKVCPRCHLHPAILEDI
ncbi:uncharacterized protein LOC144753754 isoform X1 [Lissotriton helveticus]